MSANRATTSRKRKACRAILAVIIVLAISAWLLHRQQRRAYAERTHCVGNLGFIKLAKSACQDELGLADGEPIPEKALERVFQEDLGKPMALNKCPSGGRYIVGNVGTLPTCTYTNVTITWEFQKDPPWFKRRVWKHSIGP